MSDESADVRLIKATGAAIQELRNLIKFGHPHKGKKDPEPHPTTPTQAIAYAKIRLEALKLYCPIRWGTKARGPAEIDEEAAAELELRRLKLTPKPYREAIIAGRVASGEITEEDGDMLRELAGGTNRPTENPAEQEGQESV